MFKSYFLHINGFLAAIFGLVAILFPGVTLTALGIYFAFTVLVGGIAQIAGAFRSRKNNSKWYLLLPEGIIGLILGSLILSRPELVATIFVLIIGIWAIVIGFIFVFSYKRAVNSGFVGTMMLLVGILSIIMGGVILFNPFESTRLITILIGIYTLTYGIFSIINSTKNYKKL